MNVLAIDPGQTVGVATYTDGGIRDGGEVSFTDFLHWAEKTIHEWDVIVCEEFRITPRTIPAASTARWPLDVIGCVRWWCESRDTTLVMQSASTAKTFATNDKLKKAGLYRRGLPHGMDATRHLVVYLVDQGLYDAANFT